MGPRPTPCDRCQPPQSSSSSLKCRTMAIKPPRKSLSKKYNRPKRNRYRRRRRSPRPPRRRLRLKPPRHLPLSKETQHRPPKRQSKNQLRLNSQLLRKPSRRRLSSSERERKTIEPISAPHSEIVNSIHLSSHPSSALVFTFLFPSSFAPFPCSKTNERTIHIHIT